jgi:uncharacterized protein YndB with AHSA1/START domain
MDTMAEESKPVEVSRRIEAPAGRIFEILADPQRHMDFDGSDMLRGAVFDRPISGVGDAFTMKMYFDRLGGDYLMLNYVVEFEPDRRIFWEPAPGDRPAADGEPSAVGIPAGHRWGFVLTPDGADATNVTEVFDYGYASEELRQAVREGGEWMAAMTASLERLEKICTG